MRAEGRVFKFGANVDTDVIIPARYLNVPDPSELAKHCMEDIDKDFVKNVNEVEEVAATVDYYDQWNAKECDHNTTQSRANHIDCVANAREKGFSTHYIITRNNVNKHRA